MPNSIRHSMKLTREKPVRKCPCCGSPVTAHMIYKVYPEELLYFGPVKDAWFEVRFKAKCPVCFLTMDLAKSGECIMPDSLSQMENYLYEDMQELESYWNRRTRDA